MRTFADAQETILSELRACLLAIDEEEAQQVAKALLGADRVFAIGVGRVMLMLQAFVKRLNHLGIEAYYVGEINEPAITERDVLLVASGSGESAVPVAIAKVAQKYNPQIVYIGSNMSSTVAQLAQLRLRIPCRTKLNLADELPSAQPMSSMFEQALLLTLDALAMVIIDLADIEIKGLWRKHANLE